MLFHHCLQQKNIEFILKLQTNYFSNAFIIYRQMDNEISGRIPIQPYRLNRCRSFQSFPLTKKEPSTFIRNSRQSPKINSNLHQFYRQDYNKKQFQDKKMGVITSQNLLKRVKSQQKLFEVPMKHHYEQMMEIYKNQNKNLQNQNKYLMKEIQKQKKNEKNLWMYIDQLRREVSHLESKNLVQNYCMGNMETKNSNRQASSTAFSNLTIEENPHNQKIGKSNILIKFSKQMQNTKNDTFFSSGILGSQEDEEGRYSRDNYQQLSQRFNNLMQQCSKQSNKKVRDTLRKKLAQTAQKMRNLRKLSSCNKI